VKDIKHNFNVHNKASIQTEANLLVTIEKDHRIHQIADKHKL
jgi:hypothetical protein